MISKLRVTFIIFSCIATMHAAAQVNDETSFFDGSYNKRYIKDHKIRTMTLTAYLNERKIQVSRYYFDRSGVLEKGTEIDSAGKEKERYFFTFDERGDLVLMTGTPADTFSYKKIYRDSLLVHEQLPFPPFNIDHFYNELGQKIRSTSSFNYGQEKLSQRVVEYEYDDHGKLNHVTDRILNADGRIEQWISDRTIGYKKNRIYKVKEKFANSEFASNNGNLEYTYDVRGNITSIISDVVISRLYTYDKNGLLILKNEYFPKNDKVLSKMKLRTTYTYSFWK